MSTDQILEELEHFGDDRTKKILMRHGAREPLFGVKVADLKKILKTTKKNHELSLALYKTGNSDAMYLAGLMADEKLISKDQLREWVKAAYWSYLSEFTVPWVAAETRFGYELGLEWIASDYENIASAGWATLANVAAVKADESLDITTYNSLLSKVRQEIHSAQNRVKYTMNGFVIATGTYISALTSDALRVAEDIGQVEVLMNGTACKVPLAKDYIQKCIDMGRIGKKKKVARC